jgi:hypothetical protein
MSSLSKFDSDLEKAITRGDLHSLNAALESGASANAIGKLGYPMISWAIVSKAPMAIFDALVKGGADIGASSLDGKKPGAAELAGLFCRADVAAYMVNLGFFDLRALTKAGVPLEDAYRHGDEKLRSKMDMLVHSLHSARAIDSSIGPMEEAFAPVMGRPESKGMSPL